MTNRAPAVLLAAAGVIAIVHALWIPAKAALGQALLERAWDRVQDGDDDPRGVGPDRRPWPWADTEPVARLSAPEAGASVLVLAGASGRTLAWGPGHLPGTPLPGAPGNSVVAGHRDTHFAFLEDLRPGDRLEVETPDGAVRRYRVRVAEVVHESDTRLVGPIPLPRRGPRPERALTLVTCYPFDAVTPGGPLRYVVRAEAGPVTTLPDPRGRRDRRPGPRTG